MGVQQTLTLTCVSQDKEKNTSQVRILWQSVQTGSSYNETSRTAYYYVALNGGTEEERAITYTLPYQATKTLVDQTITVPHDNSGNGYVAVRTWMNTNISAGVVQLSKALSLPQIPRESTLTAANAFIGATSRIAISKQNSSFTHSVAYKFGSLTGFVTKNGGISSTEVKFSEESVDFAIPDSFYNQIPNSPSGICTLTLKTYSGSTQIGQANTRAITVLTDPKACIPVVSGTVSDTNSGTADLTGNTGKLIRYHSHALCTITATARKGASITEKRIAGVAVSTNSRTIYGPQTGSIQFYAKDSRGYENTVTISVPIVPYISLTNNATVKRNEPTSGNATLTLAGQVFRGSFGIIDNVLRASYRIENGTEVSVTPSSDTDYTLTVPLTGMDYEKSYTITVSVWDRIAKVTKQLTLNKGLPVFDWGEKDFAFHVPVSVEAVMPGQTVEADTEEQMYEKLKQVYADMRDGTTRYVRGYVTNIRSYDIRLWRSSVNWGIVKIDTYVFSAERRMVIYNGVWPEW